MNAHEELFRTPDSPLPPEMREAFLARATRMRAGKGQLLISAGFPSNDVYLVLTGRVQVSLVSATGRETIIRDIDCHNMFGELAALDGMPRSGSISAATDCQLAMLSSEAFLGVVQSEPGFALWLAQHLTRQVRFLTSRIYELSNMNVGNRLHCELLRIAIREGIEDDKAIVDNAPTHAEFAARIGANREGVTREFGLLAAEGIVNQVGRRLEILSVDKLSLLIRQLPYFF
jgi:CRP/FNR family transcriptional regulator, cyclic AMP receptor protein